MAKNDQAYRVGTPTTFQIVYGRKAAQDARREMVAQGHRGVLVTPDNAAPRPSRKANEDEGVGFKV